MAWHGMSFSLALHYTLNQLSWIMVMLPDFLFILSISIKLEALVGDGNVQSAHHTRVGVARDWIGYSVLYIESYSVYTPIYLPIYLLINY